MVTRKTLKTLYDVLDVEKSASTDEVRRAYRKKALETHPDKLDPSASEEDKQAAELQFHRVHEAFVILGDAQKRRRYDAALALRTDPQLISEESARRMADRQEWARQQQLFAQRRMVAFKERLARRRQGKEELEEPKTPVQDKPRDKVADIFQEMMTANPEFAARRKAVLQRKAERERAAREKGQLVNQSPPVPTTA